MPRNVDPTMMAALAHAHLSLAIFAEFTLRVGVQRAWTGVGPYVWSGKTFLGVGTLGKIGDVSDSGDSKAEGTTVELSGLDAEWLADVQSELRQGAPARLWLATMTPTLELIGTPYLYFRGMLDSADVNITPPTPDGDGTSSIVLSLETPFINHARPNARRYTSADQRANGYPDDTFFDWVEQLNDLALVEGE